MKKIFILIMVLLPIVAQANRLDISRTSTQGEFSAGFGVAFVTGENSHGTHRTDFESGRIHELALDLAYTFIDRATVSFSTDNDYADAQVGIKWKILRRPAFKLDLLANYGFAWTKNATTHDRFGHNNVDGAVRIHGKVGDNFQWAFKSDAQYVWIDGGNFWNVNLTGEMMHYVTPCLAIKAAMNYDMVQINRPHTIYKPAASVGVIYNLTPTASVHPYVKYHFDAHGGDNTVGTHDDYWKLALAWSIQF